MTDHDVRNLQARGAEVIVVESHYTSEELKEARNDCKGDTGKTPNQATSPVPGQDTKTTASLPDLQFKSDASTENTAKIALVDFSSAPSQAEIEIDGSFVGTTPSSVSLTPGEHVVAIKKAGFGAWQRKITVSTGHVNVNAELASSMTSPNH